MIAALALGGVVGCREEIVLEGVANGWGAVVELEGTGEDLGIAWSTGLFPLADGFEVPTGHRRTLVAWDDYTLAIANLPIERARLATTRVELAPPNDAVVDYFITHIDRGGDMPTSLSLVAVAPPFDRRSFGCCLDSSGNPTGAHDCEAREVHAGVFECRQPIGLANESAVCAIAGCLRGAPRDVAEFSLGDIKCATDRERQHAWCEGVRLEFHPQTNHDPTWRGLAASLGVTCGLDADGMAWCGRGRWRTEHGPGWTALRPCGGDVVCGIDNERHLTFVSSFGVGRLAPPSPVPIKTFASAFGLTCHVGIDDRMHCTRAAGVVEVPGVWKDVYLTSSHVVALTTGGEVVHISRDSLDSGAGERLAGEWTELAVGGRLGCALNRAGQVWCWGASATGDCTIESPRGTPFLVPASAAGGWRDLRSDGDRMACARDATKMWACWGGVMTRPSRLCFIE